MRVMVLRARWTGPLPLATGYLMSAPPRANNAYRIISVERCRDLASVPGYTRLKISVHKILATDVPSDAVVYPWKWDPRKKAGFTWKAA